MQNSWIGFPAAGKIHFNKGTSQEITSSVAGATFGEGPGWFGCCPPWKCCVTGQMRCRSLLTLMLRGRRNILWGWRVARSVLWKWRFSGDVGGWLYLRQALEMMLPMWPRSFITWLIFLCIFSDRLAQELLDFFSLQIKKICRYLHWLSVLDFCLFGKMKLIFELAKEGCIMTKKNVVCHQQWRLGSGPCSLAIHGTRYVGVLDPCGVEMVLEPVSWFGQVFVILW